MKPMVKGMESNKFTFHRPELALQIVSALAGESLTDTSSGLFLALHRRTGKSTFLRKDLIPACENRGWLPVYVDLWANKQVSPDVLISRALADALQAYDSVAKKALKAMNVQKVSILRTLNWDLTTGVLPEDATLADAIQLLYQLSGKMVVLIIDEAQHALTSDAGMNAMFALKAARDRMNLSAEHEDGLRLVFTGSNRDKLGNLVHKRTQPFFGAQITPFPVLGNDYVEAFTAFFNKRLSAENQFGADDLKEAFQQTGHRPELLMALATEVGMGLGAAPDTGRLIRDGVLNLLVGVWDEYESAYNQLTTIQQAVLEVMGDQHRKGPGHEFAPFKTATVGAVQKYVELMGESNKVTNSGIQSALDALREAELVWKPARGSYTFEDAGMVEWLANRREVEADE
ncbi:hypothetical protein LCGC14_0170960 [marine sediment metagenome]|uniref:AAA+ ATPase domain-containing protein n=1 Tax=marine sediment metagenome TaxID=412755 RepID=A0A0F9XAS0_9ZZZZ